MTDPETAIHAALDRLLQRNRVSSPRAWLEEAVSDITKATGSAPVPTGMVAADTSGAARAMVALKDRAEVATEILEAFKQGPNGWSARVKAEQVAEWRERLGERE